MIDKLREANCITHLDLSSAYNQARISDDGPTDASIDATTFQGLNPSGAPCFLEMMVMGFGSVQCGSVLSQSGFVGCR